jgi:hypothetical protein
MMKADSMDFFSQGGFIVSTPYNRQLMIGIHCLRPVLDPDSKNGLNTSEQAIKPLHSHYDNE